MDWFYLSYHLVSYISAGVAGFIGHIAWTDLRQALYERHVHKIMEEQ